MSIEKQSLPPDGLPQKHKIVGAVDLDGAEARQMRRDKLSIEQVEFPRAQPPDEMHQRHFRGILLPAEHRLAEKRRAESHAVQPARKDIVLPRLDAVCEAEPVEPQIALYDLFGYPGIRPFRARTNDLLERCVQPDIEDFLSERLIETSRYSERVERDDTAASRRVPVYFARPRIRHGEVARAVPPEEKLRFHDLGQHQGIRAVARCSTPHPAASPS